MSDPVKQGVWWAGSRDEWYEVGPCASREEAISEGRAYFDTDFHICEAETKSITLNADRLIEDQYFDSEDLFSYEDGSEADRRDGAAEADKELQALLDDWLARHSHTFVQPTLFAWTANKECIEHGEPQ